MDQFALTERRRQSLYGWMLAGPALILLTTFAFIPAAATLWTSFHSRGTAAQPATLDGFQTYSELFHDPVFRTVVVNNLIYAGVTIPVSIAIAFSMALWANANIAMKGLVRSAYFTPIMGSMVAAAFRRRARCWPRRPCFP